jgi:hypothetical protein
MYAHPDNSIYSNNLILGWKPLDDIVGNPVELSPRKAWDAEYTHNWLINYFFPRVYNWAIENESNHKKISIFDKSLKEIFIPQSPTKYRSLENIAWSCTDISKRNIGLRVTNKLEAVNLITELQSHFHVYTSQAPIEVELIKAVVQVCRHIISTRPNYKGHYFKSNLQISGDDLYAEIEKVESQLNEESRCPFNLDLVLRALYGLFDDITDLDDDDLAQLTELIRPVWDRFVEDTICKSYY